MSVHFQQNSSPLATFVSSCYTHTRLVALPYIAYRLHAKLRIRALAMISSHQSEWIRYNDTNTPKRQEDVWQVFSLRLVVLHDEEFRWTYNIVLLRQISSKHIFSRFLALYRATAHICARRLSRARSPAEVFLHVWYLRWIAGVFVPPSVMSGVRCILAFSLVFHTVTPECNSFRENPTYFDLYLTLNTWYCLWSD